METNHTSRIARHEDDCVEEQRRRRLQARRDTKNIAMNSKGRRRLQGRSDTKKTAMQNIDEEDWENVSLICNYLEPFKQGTCFYLF